MSAAIDPVSAYDVLLALSREQRAALAQADPERFLALDAERQTLVSALPALDGVGPEAARTLRETIEALIVSDAALQQALAAHQEGTKRDLASLHDGQHARHAYEGLAGGSTSLFFEGNA